MEVFLLWSLLSFAVGIWASSRGRSGVGWFFFSMILSPLLGFVFVAVIGRAGAAAAYMDGPSPDTHVKCPMCAELVRKEAKLCKHCGTRLVPQD